MNKEIKNIIDEIKKETELGFEGMDEYAETLEDSYVCTYHFDRINDLICKLEKELQ